MSHVEYNSKLGLKFSSAFLPERAFPKFKDSLPFVDATNGIAILLDGYNYQAEQINAVAIPVLSEGLKQIDGQQYLNLIADQMRKVFITGSEVVRQMKGIVGGTNALAVRFSEIGRTVMASWGHTGRNRLYHLNNFVGMLSLETVDAGYSMESDRGRVEFDQEEFAYLAGIGDRVKNKEELERYKTADWRVDNFWSQMLVPPLYSLGSETTQIQTGVKGLLRPGDKLLLASLAVYRSMTSYDMADILVREQDSAQVLAERAQDISAQQGNFRAVTNRGFAAIVVERV